MSNPTVLTTLGHVPPEATPLDINELIDLLRPRLSSTIQGSYQPYVVQHDTPDVGQRGYAWIELDTQQRPIATKVFWHGSWRRIYNGMLGEIRMYSGDPTVDFDTRGLGHVGLTYDGWHLCNGKDGAIDLSDRFVIGGHMNNDGSLGWNGSQWVTTVLDDDGSNEGGVDHVILTDKTTWRPETPGLTLHEWSANGNAPANPGDLWGLQNTAAKADTLINPDPGNTTPDQFSVVPPFIAMGFIIFVGYAT